MSLFDSLVETALRGQTGLTSLRPVVEKELLHQDILRELSVAGLLKGLTFIGGTCLRLCYGSNRLSEDLDFTGGSNFDRGSLEALANVLVARLQRKYGLDVSVDSPVRESGNVDTWRVKLQTRPERRDMPAQRINIDIDICSVPSYDVQPMMLRDHRCEPARYLQQLQERQTALQADPKVQENFMNEMRRFLPVGDVADLTERAEYWQFLSYQMGEYMRLIRQRL